ncbi:MAG: hypothetical protein HYX24_07735 [Candidatus Aenigmarchaeota archaeon]|nr:hypothetical protein [Candidatus Aenigmarchaeota archaeon]
MSELEIRIPEALKGEKERLERQIEEFISFEAKRKMLLEFIDDVMKGSKQLSDEELVELSRKVKKGRFEKAKAELEQMKRKGHA